MDEGIRAWILSERRGFIDGVSSILRKYGIDALPLPPGTRDLADLRGILVVDTADGRGISSIPEPGKTGAGMALEVITLREPDEKAVTFAVERVRATAALCRELSGYKSSLHDIGAVIRALNRPLSDIAAIPTALRELMDRLRCPRLLMLAAEEGGGELGVFYQMHLSESYASRISSREGLAFLGGIFTQVLSVVDVIEKALLVKLMPAVSESVRLLDLLCGEGDFLLFTLKSNRRPVGMVVLGFDREISWQPQEKESLSLLGMQLGLALENLQLFSRVQAARREWEATVDSMRDMVFFVNRSGEIQRANAALAEYAEVPLAEMIGRGCSDVLPCGQSPETCVYYEGALRDGMAGFELAGDDGRAYRVLLTPYRSERDNASGTVHLVSDITAEKERMRLEEEKRQLQELDNLKSRFMATVSHELKTPLNAIIGFSEILLAGTHGEVNEPQRRYLENIHTSGKHLFSLISDILDYMRLEAREMSLQVEGFNLDDLVASTVELMRGEADAGGLLLAYCGEASPVKVEADRRRVRQVLFNLLSNALKFTPEGGNVEVRVRRGDGAAVVEVEDSGVGIAPRDQARLFNEFTQVGEGARSGGGTGLGLALSKRLVELHGGHIWVESEPGRGSIFSFSLPLRHEADTNGKEPERDA